MNFEKESLFSDDFDDLESEVLGDLSSLEEIPVEDEVMMFDSSDDQDIEPSTSAKDALIEASPYDDAEKFHLVELTALDLAIARTSDGLLDFSEVYGIEKDEDEDRMGAWEPVEVDSEVSSLPTLAYYEVPWTSIETEKNASGSKRYGSVSKFETTTLRTLKAFFIKADDPEHDFNAKLDFRTVVAVDGNAKSVKMSQVQNLELLDLDRAQLRIKADGTLAIVDPLNYRSHDEIIREKDFEELEEREGGGPDGELPEELMKEMEEMEYEPDVPEVDLM
ncbi:hypothetical protein CYMTET_52193 [Cymbomonas tetramitiformis]|uniref:Uncharacterized protein n=1 Tax=Cymbomonas tetramitiformis TaxID=36881 RepID=A0AAE0BKY4_9CHLO|nr:hypothetical protein CYMTET_52193 [Cymbomonas tetramitiformis]|eukprot:gene1467-2090_t